MTGGVLNRREFLRQSSCLGLALVLPVFPDQPVLRPPGARRDFLPVAFAVASAWRPARSIASVSWGSAPVAWSTPRTLTR